MPANCTFTLVDGLVPTVEVFHYGSSAYWEGVKAGFEENRGGVTEVPGVGEEAFQPNDAGPYEIVVRYLDIIYSVAVFSGGGPEVEAAILELAERYRRRLIASSLSNAGPCGPEASGTYNPGPLCRI